MIPCKIVSTFCIALLCHLNSTGIAYARDQNPCAEAAEKIFQRFKRPMTVLGIGPQAATVLLGAASNYPIIKNLSFNVFTTFNTWIPSRVISQILVPGEKLCVWFRVVMLY